VNEKKDKLNVPGLRVREFPESNYKAVFHNGRTFRFRLDDKKPWEELEYPEFYDVAFNSYCRGSCPYCFLPNTIISMGIGFSEIQNIKVGDTVKCSDGKSIVERGVDQIHVRDVDEDIVVIEFDNGNLVKVTANHKFMTQRGWVPAGELTEADDLVDCEA